MDQFMAFNNKNGHWFWSNGYQYGTVTIKEENGKKVASLMVLDGGTLI
ncbi:hypothetical protein [Seonamhaeicola sp.]|nr:hypothetical protein [Seonamhaeicola sp.]